MNSGDEYTLGTGDDEIDRLAFQHHIWRTQATSAWERAGFKIGDKILDLGCGPGFTTIDLANFVSEKGFIYAVDLSKRFIEFLKNNSRLKKLSNIEAQINEIESISYREKSLDGVYARWVLCFVKDPELVVSRISKFLKKGCPIVIQDYYNYDAVVVGPRNEIFERVYRATGEAWRKNGGNPNVGLELPQILERNGFRIKDILPHVRIAKPDSEFWKWPETYLFNFLPTVVELGLLSIEEITAFQNEWEKLSETDGAFYSSPGIIEIIGVKE